jgi:hypothetical protein
MTDSDYRQYKSEQLKGKLTMGAVILLLTSYVALMVYFFVV